MPKVGQIEFLSEYMKMFSLEYKIIIFGAGENGLKLLEMLKKCGRVVDFFCDNNVEKTDTFINGICCVSYEELKNYKNSAVIFVSPDMAQDIYTQLEEDGFSNVVPEPIRNVLFFLPTKEITLLPIGHFYSLYPDFSNMSKQRRRIFDKKKDIEDIVLNEEYQCEILERMKKLYDTLPEWEKWGENVEANGKELRYTSDNPSLSNGDAVALHCMLRMIRPKKVIEVGSGFSSALILDTNEYYLNNEMKCYFIEPYPDLLKSLCKSTDNISLQKTGLENVELEFFEQLESGDVLFVDSTHVSKTGSDVNYLFFEILPRLKKGVYIHLHDIFYPFEYPEEWIMENGMIWNELYLLRAFLQNNKSYSVEFFHNMMEQKHMDLFMEKWPFSEKPHGGSIWLRKQ